MNGRHVMVDSPEMGRKVHVWCFGYFGMPVVVFPSVAGFAHEWKVQGMIETLQPLLQAGKIKNYTVLRAMFLKHGQTRISP